MMSETSCDELLDFLQENMAQMSEGPFKVVLAVGRWGPGRFTHDQLAEETGLSRKAVSSALATARKRGWIKREKDGSSYRYRINNDKSECSNGGNDE